MNTKKGAIAAIFFEKRVKTKDGLHPIKLRISFNRERKYYIIKYSETDEAFFRGLHGKTVTISEQDYELIQMSAKDFKKVKGDKTIEWHSAWNIMFMAIRKRANGIIQKIPVFSFELFEEYYYGKHKDENDLFSAFVERSTELRKDGKIGTAVTYESTLSSLREYTGKNTFPFNGVSERFLKTYEKWMLSPRKVKVVIKGKKQEKTVTHGNTTVSIYLRCLRAIFKKYAPQGTYYPFGEGRYQIPYWDENKRALTIEDISLIQNYKTIAGSPADRAKDYWMFSYLTNGINFADMARLRYRNIIDGDQIEWVRVKTYKKGKKPIKITAMLLPESGRVVDKYGQKPALPNTYIFPFLNDSMTPEQIHRAVAQAVKTTNKYMSQICHELNIPQVGTYSARHSYASVLRKAGVGIEYIGEKLGHTSLTTTKNYLREFGRDVDMEHSVKLLIKPTVNTGTAV